MIIDNASTLISESQHEMAILSTFLILVWSFIHKFEATLRITLRAEACLFKLEMPRSWKWPEDPIGHGAGAYHGVFVPDT